MDFKKLATKYGTPCFVYDFDNIIKKYNDIKNIFKARKSLVCYAVKANSNLSLLKHLSTAGAGADCVSVGEIRRAILAGIKPYKIIFSGVGKKDDEIEYALQHDILFINIESSQELARVEQVAKELGKVARISVRINPDIDPKTHSYISTGLHENKFGVDIDEAKRLYIYVKNSSHLEPIGVHMHIGSQLTQLQPIREAVNIVANLVRNLQALKIDIKFFDVGGGLAIRYTDEKLINTQDYGQMILEELHGLDVTIVAEPGRYIVGDSGYLLTKVLYEKANDSKRFVIVDGAMNDLIRPSLYQATHRIEVHDNTTEKSLCTVVGPICESGDFFAKDISLPSTARDDIVVIHDTGAYGYTMSSNYNTRAKAVQVAVQDGVDRCISAAETFDDMIKLELEFMKGDT